MSANRLPRDINDPGALPYTRAFIRALRGQAVDDAQFAGFGTPGTPPPLQESARRRKYGLSVAFDLPTLMGRDPDHPLALGETGKCGVNVTSLADMETLSTASRLATSRVDDDQTRRPR